jgi:hypothetical protein
MSAIVCLRTVEELTRVLLFVKHENNGRTPLDTARYRKFSDAMDAMIDHIDDEYESVRYHDHEPSPAEARWAATNDPKDLYVQQLARAARADYVVSDNTDDFPNRRTVRGQARGELDGVVWIQPADFFTCFNRELPVAFPVLSDTEIGEVMN